MRVLLLTQAFPPHPEVGAIRSSNLARAFLEAGHQVTVITEAVAGSSPAEASFGEPAPRVITVEPGLPHPIRISRVLRKLRSPFAARAGAPGESSRGATAEQEQPGLLRRLALAALSLPDSDNHLIEPFHRAASEVLAEGADLIYSSAPPFSLHLAARRLHRRFGIPWVAEFRDPWQHPWSERAAYRHHLTRWLDTWMERRVLATADLVVMATEAARDFIAPKVPPGRRERILVARNGTPDWSAGSASPPSGGPEGAFRIVHAGSFYMGRNPAGFFEGLALFLKRTGRGPSTIQVELIGKSRSYQGVSTAGLIERLGLGEFVQIEDWLPHAEARERLLAADALLLFAQGQPLQVPNKLYEYLVAGAPILAFVDKDGESARILRDLPQAHLFFDAGAEQVAATLARLLAPLGSARPEKGKFVVPEGMSSREQMRALVSEIAGRLAR